MSIKFILDNLETKDREEIQNIIKSLQEIPIKEDKKADFLRRFTLAVINTFKKDYHPEIHEININTPEKISYQPRVPEKLTLNLKSIEVPEKVDIPLELYLEAPKKVDIPKELIEEAPEKS